MNSLFEIGPTTGHDIPNDLIAAGGRGISLLEFFAIEDERTVRVNDTPGPSAVDPDFVANERALQTRAMIDAARTEARSEGAAAAREEFEDELEERLTEEHARVEQLSAEFAMDRQRYFAAAEAQVVRLALAIARRVLSREIVADDMHLAATVRAALARVHDGSESILRVSAQQAEAWRTLFVTGLDARVEVIADERMGAGECMLETKVGRVELGVEIQLQEIERGFSDLTRRQGE